MSSQNSKNLSDFMEKYKLAKESTETYTHTKINGGKWKIPNDKLGQFFELYHNDVFNSKTTRFNTLTEANSKVTQIKIDLDFRYTREDNAIVRIYTIEDIQRVCELYMRIIDKYLIVPTEKRLCFLLEKEHAGVWSNKHGEKRDPSNGRLIIKDGVHIMFPYIITHSKIANKIRDDVVKEIGDILDKYNFYNNYNDIVDSQVIDRNNWFLYGSSKVNEPIYLVTNIIKFVGENKEYISPNTYSNLDYIKIFSILNRDIEPWRLSIREEYKYIVSIDNLAIKADTLKHKHESIKKSKKTFIKIEEDLHIILKIVDCLDPDLRAHNYREWIELGWCLYNIHNVDNTLLDKWIEFSKLDPLYASMADEACRREWANARGDGFGYGTLIMWARMDSDRLKEQRGGKHYLDDLMNSSFDNKIMSFVTKNKLEQNDIATLMYTHFKHDYVCVCKNKSKYVWYKFENHKWHELNSHSELRLSLSKILAKKFSKVSETFLHKYNSNDDENENSERYLDWSTRANNISKKLRQTAFKNSVITECQDEFINEARDFIDKMDENPYLLGCLNGVYDLKKLEFRDGRPDDYITLSTKIDYNDEYSWDHPTIKNIMHVIEQILPIKSVREYTMLVLSTTLDGSTKQEKFYIFSGSGGNGKSKLIEMLDLALGDYSKNVSVALLTKKRADSNSANPELAATKGRRVVKFQEAEENSVLNVGLMKEISGGDKIVTRALFQDPIEFKPQFKAFFICNDKPTLPPNDEGTWRRVRLIEFISKFVSNPSLDPDRHEYPIDLELSDKIKGWGEAFLWILIEYYKIYRSSGSIVEPPEVLEYTSIYRRQNDHFLEFFNDCIEPETNGKLLLNDAYKVYRQWFKENQQGSGVKNRKKEELRNYLIKQLGKEYDTTQSMHKIADERIRGTCWLGYKLSDINNKTNILTNITNSITDELDGE